MANTRAVPRGYRCVPLRRAPVAREITAPFDPKNATEEFAKLLKSCSITGVTGDRYAGQWCAQHADN
jgi:hypothetical protein